MNVPNWWATILLALSAFRVWRLLAEDDILDRPRRYVTHLGTKWQKEGDPLPKGYRIGLARFIDCPYCLGAHCAFAFWLAWIFWPHGTLVAAAPLAISALLPLANKITE